MVCYVIPHSLKGPNVASNGIMAKHEEILFLSGIKIW